MTSFINLSGLAIGLTCCLLILIYILHETSYDRYNQNADRVYRVTRQFNGPNGSISLHLGTVAPPFGPLLQNDFPDIQAVTRLLENGVVLRYQDKKFNEDSLFFADENLSKVFDIRVVAGSSVASALKDPYSLMLSENTAKKYFGSEDPLDKVVRLDNRFDCKITGVFKSFPENAHLHPSMLLSFNTLNDTAIYGAEGLRSNWGNNAFFTYLLLPKGYPADKLQAQFPAFLDRHMPAKDYGAHPSKGTELFLQKLTDIHLHSHLDSEAEENGDIQKVYLFGAIALFILLIACINYMNLSTARSSLRAREIGIRKAIGAMRLELIVQFLGESVLITWIALVLALGLTQLMLPFMARLSGVSLSMGMLATWKIWIPLVLMPFVVGILSGLYPALFLSGFKPVKVLKGVFKVNGSDLSFRKVLVVLQFSISIVLIIATAVVFQQIRFIQSKSLGYNRQRQVIIPYTSDLDKSYESFKAQLLDNPHVRDMARSSRIPTGRLLDEEGVSVEENGALKSANIDLKYVNADFDFIPTYGISMKAGRNFSKAYATDSAGFIINESAVAALGWKSPGEAIGKHLSYGGEPGMIIGVMSDFNFESLHQRISPLILTYPTKNNGGYNNISISIEGNDVPATLARIEQTWKRFLPETPYQYNFLDERFEHLYITETRQGTIFTLFSGIAIFIACLGLLGLSAFAISQRIKEIGIRQVLGAGKGSIVQLISKDFLRLVLIAVLIAFPVAWYAMHNWLEGFAYRTQIHWWIFVLAGGVALLVAFITISIQTVKAASANPIKNLRTE